MPYARKAYSRRPYKRRTSVKRGRPPVPKKRKTASSYIRNNSLAVRANSRKISRLISTQFGPVQRNLQQNDNTLIINATQPLVFDAADFCSRRTAPGGQAVPGCQIWQVNNLGLQITSAGSFLADETNALWGPSNTDIPDGGRYKPLYAEYQIEVTGRDNLDSTHIQMNLFTQHHGFQTWQLAAAGTSVNQRTMPYALTNMKNMCTTNLLNPSLFKSYKVKRMLINSQTSLQSTTTTVPPGTATSGVTATTSNVKYFRFRVAPKKTRRQVYTTPDTPGIPDDPQEQTQFGPYGLYQVDPRTPFWCMLSTTDRTSLDGDSVQIKIRRHVCWRDQNGGTFL